MPDRIEEILKNIHILLAKGESFQTSPDKVVISKHEMFELLEELSEAVYEVMDKYEATAHSRERARIELDRNTAELVEAAHKKAEDVHAASLLYTDHMLETINSIIDAGRANVKREMIELLARLDDQQSVIGKNMSGIKDDLADLNDGAFYLRTLDELRQREEEKRRYGSGAEADEEEPASGGTTRENIVIRVDRPGSNSGVSVSTRHSRGRKNRKGRSAGSKETASEGRGTDAAEQGADDVPTPSGTVFTADDFNLDSEYEAWKQQNGGGDSEDKPEPAKRKRLLGFLHRK